MRLKVVIAGGGTGGHLFPGIAVAQEFRSRHGADVTFLTTPKAITAQILERYGFSWQALASRALKGQKLIGRIRTLLQVPGSILEAKARLQALEPHLVLGMGGHTSGPVGVAAYRLGIPLALHEQNAIPGLTNRYLARLASRVFLSFPGSRSYFASDNCLWTGNPIRGEFFEADTPRPPEPFTVLIMGGSQGAHHLNMETLAALPWLADLKDRLHFLHITGEYDQEEVEALSPGRLGRGGGGLYPGGGQVNGPGAPGGLPVRRLHPGGDRRGGPGGPPGALPLCRQQPSGAQRPVSGRSRGRGDGFK